MTETITITFHNGDVVTFTGCTAYNNSGVVVSFKGKKAGESVAASWEFPFADIASVRRVSE